MKPRRLLLLLGLCCLAPTIASAADTVLRPRGAESAQPVAPGVPGPSGTTTLGLALVCAAVGGWLFWRQRRNAGPGGRGPERRLAIVETRPLGNRQHLVVADYAGRKFLLGVCPGRIDLLAPLDQSGPPPSAAP